MQIEFNTPRGATVTIIACDLNGFDALVNGNRHTSFGAKFIRADAEVGPHFALAGNVKAPVPAEMIAEIAAWVDAAKAAQKDRCAIAKAEAAKEFYTENRMRDMHSRYSVN